MTTKDKTLNNVVTLGDQAGGYQHQSTALLEEKSQRLDQVDLELQRKARDLQNMERAFERAHANLEKRIAERTRELTEANARLRKKAQESARLEAVFGKVISNLEQRIEDRAVELLRSNYSVGSKIVDGPGREGTIRLVDECNK